MKILLLSRYARLGASSRLRSFQYLPFLAQAGFEVTVRPLFDDNYVRGLSGGTISKVSVLQAYLQRLRFILAARHYDWIWLESEMLPWMPSWIELALLPKHVRLLVDYDDAIFHRYDQHHSSLVKRLLGKKIDAVMRRADVVTVGNDYLGARAQAAGAKQVEHLPTVIDLSRYKANIPHDTQIVTIGWIGQPSTAKYLLQLAPVLKKMVEKYPIRIVAIGPKPDQLQDLPIEVKPWAEDTETNEIQRFDIGIMPLADTLWERGKCGYKLIQYMACGKPVVATPVGVNKVIVREGDNGFLARDDAAWLNALDLLCRDAGLRKRLGDAGRADVEQTYSLQITAPQLVELFKSAPKM